MPIVQSFLDCLSSTRQRFAILTLVVQASRLQPIVMQAPACNRIIYLSQVARDATRTANPLAAAIRGGGIVATCPIANNAGIGGESLSG